LSFCFPFLVCCWVWRLHFPLHLSRPGSIKSLKSHFWSPQPHLCCDLAQSRDFNTTYCEPQKCNPWVEVGGQSCLPLMSSICYRASKIINTDNAYVGSSGKVSRPPGCT
jgi:hypothetical protein